MCGAAVARVFADAVLTYGTTVHGDVCGWAGTKKTQNGVDCGKCTDTATDTDWASEWVSGWREGLCLE